MNPAAARNFDLKEEIRSYWSARAAGFDGDAGHRIEDGAAALAWGRLLRRGLGPLQGRRVLDLACGTGEISRVLVELGASVTGADFAEPMLDRARQKLRGRDWRGVLTDAETLAALPDRAFDGAVTRHLVWTLTDPVAAFAAWFRVLKPGGRLLVVDGDWVGETARTRLLRRLAAALAPAAARSAEDAATHREILSRVPYREGLTRERLLGDLARAGFVNPASHAVLPIYLVAMRRTPLADRLRLLAPARFAVSVARPPEFGR